MGIRKVAETIFDRAKLGLFGFGKVFSRPKYAIFGIFCIILIAYILSFWQNGNGNWQLICSGLPLGDKLGVLGRVFLNIGENFTSLWGISIILLAILQGIVIAQLVFTWRHREKNAALDGASTGGIGAILGFIALGCPSCGIGLLTPILSAIAGASAVAMAETIGKIFTILAFSLLIFTILGLGYIDYVLASVNNRKEKHAKSN
ncbi:hypothetical protein IKH79_02570 [Candidatus Saccharibacteria bacterium]|nr:hypothetical protein [Candidatus Saccharibacteria bacterium]